MNQNIPEIPWRMLWGNKYNRCLHPSMLSQAGYRKDSKTKALGDSVTQVYRVHYDREYVLEHITRKVCIPLKTLTPREFSNLISVAWREATNDETVWFEPVIDK